jgi:tetraacyldisaccharide 4'-kinase
MTDKRNDPLAQLLKFILWVLSLMYGMIVRILSGGYEKKFFIPYKADPKVVSIGNITVGGTGKTQAAITISKILESSGRRVSILIRGYGADEYRMLEEELKDVPILVGPDRIKNSKRAFYDFGVDTVILDDGFQHYKIYRDLDIVLVDATNPFGNLALIPRGILREPINALKRADLIIINKIDAEHVKLGEVNDVIDRFGKASCVLKSVYTPLNLYEIANNKAAGLRCIDRKKVCIVSSIANPEYFKQNIARLGAQIELEFTFLDHYNYKKEDFVRIEKECKFLRLDFIIVTKKDAVKIKRLALSSEMTTPILVLEVDFSIITNKELLYDRLSRIYSN